MTNNTIETDILVIGSGLAGAIAALTAAEENKKVILITNSNTLLSGNTRWAQGGIVYSPNNRSQEILKDDIYTAGGNDNHIDAVNQLVSIGPKLIEEIAKEFGSQCMVLSVEAKQNGNDYWEAYTDNGREKTGLSVIDWIKKGIEHGAGEILITSIDMEGTRKGSDLKLLNKLSPLIKVPLIYSGGIGNVEHFLETIKIDAVDGIAMADIFHYKLVNVKDIRNSLINNGIPTRYTEND